MIRWIMRRRRKAGGHAADVQDRDGAKSVLKRSRARFPFVEKVYADGGYAGRLVQ
jgi:hypothetical protein